MHNMRYVANFLSYISAKYYKVWSTFDQVIPKIKRVSFLWFTVYISQSNILVSCTGGPSETWPWPTAVRHQCCCSSNDWSAQIRPRYAAAERHTGCVYLQLSARFSATLPTRSHSACRWSHFTTSTAVVIFICPAGAGNATYNIWWQSVCRRWASCLEYPIPHRLFVIAHFQTISQDLSIQSITLST